jgi:hypothetical protein
MKGITLRECATHATTISEEKEGQLSVSILKNHHMLRECAKDVTSIIIIKPSGKNKR